MSAKPKRPAAAAGPKTALKWTCTFEYKDKEGVTRHGKGRTFVVAGQDVDLFPTGVLCDMLHRSRKTLYVWEEKFGFPQALYHLDDDERRKRWYSRNQLIAVRTVYEHFNRLSKTDYSNLPNFVTAVRRVFATVDIPIQERQKE